MIFERAFFAFCFSACLYSQAQNLYKGDVSAETEMDFLTKGNYSEEYLKCVWDDTTAYHGKRSVRIEWDGKQKFIKRDLPFEDRMLSFDSQRLERGKKYTISFYAKSDVENFPLRIFLYPNDGMFTKGSTYRHYIKLTTNWKRYSFTFEPIIKTPGLASGHPEQFAIQEKGFGVLGGYSTLFDFGNAPSGKIWYDAVQIEEGTKATEFKPPCEMYAGITLNSSDGYHIYLKGEPVKSVIRTSGGGTCELNGRILDYKGNVLKNFRRTVTGGETFEYAPVSDRLGWFKFIVELIKDGQKISEHSVNYIVIKEPVDVAEGIQPYCGSDEPSGFVHTFPILKKLGVKRMQVRASWYDKYEPSISIEDNAGRRDWSIIDRHVKAARENGFFVKLIVNPFSTPPRLYAKEEYLDAERAMGKKISLVPDISQHHHWKTFIRELAERYKSSVGGIDLGAEDNGRLGRNTYYMKKYPDGVMNGWLVSGKPFDDLCGMVRTGAEEILKVNPNIQVGAIRPSMGRPGDQWLFVEKMFEKTGKSFNVFPLDTYMTVPYDYGPDIKEELRSGSIDGRIYTYELAKKLIGKYGNKQSVFISEAGSGCDQRYPDESIYRQRQSEDLFKDHVISRGVGFFAYDTFMQLGGFSLGKYNWKFHQTRKIQSVAAAYSASAQLVENVVETKILQPDHVTRIILFKKNDGWGVAVVWSEKGHSLLLDKVFQATDMMGNPVVCASGKWELSLAPVCFYAPKYDDLRSAMEKAQTEQRNFARCFFRKNSDHSGELRFVNLSSTRSILLECTVKQGAEEKKYEVPIFRGSHNTLDLPLHAKKLSVRTTLSGRTDFIENEFEIPELIPLASDSMTILGRLDSQHDILPNEPWVQWSGPDDLSVNILASWDKKNLNLRVEVKDDFHFNSFGTRTWEGDSIQIGIDADNTGTLGQDRQKYLEFGLSLGSDGKIHRSVSHGDPRLFSGQEFNVVRDEKKGMTVYTASIPWKTLNTVPAHGKVFGMAVAVFDGDSAKGTEYYATFGAGITGKKNPAGYKRFILK